MINFTTKKKKKKKWLEWNQCFRIYWHSVSQQGNLGRSKWLNKKKEKCVTFNQEKITEGEGCHDPTESKSAHERVFVP